MQLSISNGEELMKFLSVGVGAVLVMEGCQVESRQGGWGGEGGQSTGHKTIECWLLLLSGMEIFSFQVLSARRGWVLCVRRR